MNKIPIIMLLTVCLILIGYIVYQEGLIADIDHHRALQVEYIEAQDKLLVAKDETIEELLEKNRQSMVLIQERNLYFKEQFQEVQEFLKGFDTATITKYAPLDPNAIEGMCYSGNPNITSTGTQVREGVIAVDPNRIPYGSKVLIEGFSGVFTAEDTGSAMRNADGIHIDVFTQRRADAFNWGVRERKIIILGDD